MEDFSISPSAFTIGLFEGMVAAAVSNPDLDITPNSDLLLNVSNTTTNAPANAMPPETTGAPKTESIICLSLLFILIGLVGIIGNFLVIWVIMTDRKMRSSVTNLFILNLAAADLLIMLFGVPEISQFMVNRGWLLGPVMCRVERYTLVFSLYASIMTLVSVCIERYVAIVHPIRAHILCSRKRIVIAISVIWPLALLLGLPTVLFNQVGRPNPNFPFNLCMLTFPSYNHEYKLAYKAVEFVLFFFGPVVTQSILYSIICKQLFVGTKELYRRPAVSKAEGVREKDSDAIRARKGVVKMLIASVLVYFLSYAPAQLPLIYNMIIHKPFNSNWSFLVLLMTLAYVNSAANPILYCIFSQNFRRSFKRALCVFPRKNKAGRGSPTGDTSMGPRGEVRFGSLRGQQTATTALMSEALLITRDEKKKEVNWA